jgi:Predicted nucleotide-binding protein containing TIR-like domain
MKHEIHRAFSGLLGVMEDKKRLNKSLRNKLEAQKSTLEQNGFISIKILDTFFSDTFNDAFLDTIAEGVKEGWVKLEMLLLNPFSENAQRRLQELDPQKNDFGRIFIGLARICRALGLGIDSFSLGNAQMGARAIVPWLSAIQAQLERLQGWVVIKMANQVNFPICLIGEYVFSGQFKANESAAQCPWYLWVNNPAITHDQFDIFQNHFDTQFARAMGLEVMLDMVSKTPKVLICHGHGAGIHEFFASKIKAFGLEPISFVLHLTANPTNMIEDTLREIFLSSVAAVVILTADDIVINQGTKYYQARPNVMMELGLASAMLAPHVALVMENKAKKPSNLDGWPPFKIKRIGEQWRLMDENRFTTFLLKAKETWRLPAIALQTTIS